MVDLEILTFSGMHYYLSNFYESPFKLWGLNFRTVEAAYQSGKNKHISERVFYQYLTPKEAISKSLFLKIRDDWEEVKESIMYEILYAKFSQNVILKGRLLATGTRLIKDDQKTVSKDSVDVGKLLMKVREELKK